ncbi:hypothetical protein RAT170B_0331 [Rickettsia argasii T170-B]|uniref:Uncharacterized protein n=1 Tax=Rickettsia argasii T170-B TaxID=1268837 RepID=A0A0F3RHM7_9RICK|nr:hypothetical protein RAT170B_0331 [Rickettsia argasii T170-B]
MSLPSEYYSQCPTTALNKLKNFIKTKKYDEIKSILASKNSYNC